MADAMHTHIKESRVNTMGMGNIVGMAEGTVVAKYLVSSMHDLSLRRHGCHIFSKLDLRKEYSQIPMQPEDIQMTIITLFGLCALKGCLSVSIMPGILYSTSWTGRGRHAIRLNLPGRHLDGPVIFS
jgi:hypothetical protein